jgi:hypothetical protein
MQCFFTLPVRTAARTLSTHCDMPRAGRNPACGQAFLRHAHSQARLAILFCKENTMIRFIALLAATLLSVTAIAGDDKAKKDTTMKSTAATFESLDKNADSQISKTEAAGDKMLSDSFASADTNGDGYLSKSEYMAREKT